MIFKMGKSNSQKKLEIIETIKKYILQDKVFLWKRKFAFIPKQIQSSDGICAWIWLDHYEEKYYPKAFSTNPHVVADIINKLTNVDIIENDEQKTILAIEQYVDNMTAQSDSRLIDFVYNDIKTLDYIFSYEIREIP